MPVIDNAKRRKMKVIMSKNYSSRFLIGLLFGIMVTVIVWYWQKSTSAENGALALLDRLAAAEGRLRELKRELDQRRSVSPVEEKRPSAPEQDASIPPGSLPDLKKVKGIGPVFEERLHRAGIHTSSQLCNTGGEELAAILDVARGRAESILVEAAKVVDEE